MNSGMIAIAFIAGVLLLAVGLIVTTLPLFSDNSIPFPWLFLGGACLVAGALSLWRLRKLAASPVPDQPESSRSFFAVLGIFNILIFAVSLSVQAEKWRGVIWGLAALGILLCAVALVRRVSK